MPVEFGIWKIGEKPEKVSLTGFAHERDLKDVLWSDISILDSELMLIGKEVATDYGVPINVVFVRAFKHGSETFLARSWLISPDKAESNSERSLAKEKTKEPWNGEDFYVAIGESQHRSWDDCIKYGFVSAGGGLWYSRTLSQLQPGHRIFACIPQTGYVGVGIVKDTSVPVDKFSVGGKPLLQLPLAASNMGEKVGNPDEVEHVVRVEWIKTLPRDKAIWVAGMFANQNSACKLRNKFTLEKLTAAFDLEE